MQSELLGRLLDYAVSPATSILAIYFYDKLIASKRNGPNGKELSQTIDMAMTEHFDQLRRDLSTTIEKAAENSIMKWMWEIEKRGERRKFPR